METPSALKVKIEQALDQLTPDQLAKLWEYLEQLSDAVAPLYSIYEDAIDAGVSELAESHDQNLYSGR